MSRFTKPDMLNAGDQDEVPTPDEMLVPEFEKYGPLHDYRGAHVIDPEGRLAEIVGLRTVVDRSFTTAEQSTVAILRRFNGEPAGEQLLSSLRILVRR